MKHYPHKDYLYLTHASLCGIPIDEARKLTYDLNEVDCVKCLALLIANTTNQIAKDSVNLENIKARLHEVLLDATFSVQLNCK